MVPVEAAWETVADEDWIDVGVADFPSEIACGTAWARLESESRAAEAASKERNILIDMKAKKQRSGSANVRGRRPKEARER